MKAKILRANIAVLKMWLPTLQVCVSFILDYSETLFAKQFGVDCSSDVCLYTVYDVRMRWFPKEVLTMAKI